MPEARRKKKTDFTTSPVKSVFLYGKPNTGKRELLERMVSVNTDLVNRDIDLIHSHRYELMLPLAKGDRKDSSVRVFEKTHRPEGVNSAFCQNAFDTAFTKLANRMDAIRIDLYRRNQTVFAQSKVLFAMSVLGRGKDEMEDGMREIAAKAKRGQKFYLDAADTLRLMDDASFHNAMLAFADEYTMADLLFAVPYTKREPVYLDSRLAVFAEAESVSATHVLTVTNPFEKNRRFEIPVTADRDGLRRLRQYGCGGTLFASVTEGRLLRVQASVKKKVRKPGVSDIIGVDTGMTDCFYSSDGRSAGSMKEAVRFYKDVVEPAFAELSKLRGKKKKILHYVHAHELSEDVRTCLLTKADRLEHMIQAMDAPYRKKRHYYNILNHEVSASVKEYIEGLVPGTLTAMERLDIKEFRQSRRLNGELSVFARGLLQKRLMEQLNWHGFDFVEIEPAYSSQTCPVCGKIDKASRNGKDFTCTCCGHHDDADHNASVILKSRTEDREFLSLCDEYKYNSKALREHILILGGRRNSAWLESHSLSI